MIESNPLPNVGALVGCYKLLRQIAQGPFGPLYELRAEAESKGLNGLGRLLAVPTDLDPDALQQITEAAWDSMEVRHEHALCVADLVFGQGWVLLVHDHSEGTLLRTLQRRCQERQSSFPLPVALRVALDMLDALDANQQACESSGVNWNPGGQSAASLYVCGNGRTRSLDGQLVATLLRTERVRDEVSNLGFPAPELLDPTARPDERTDVFSVGTVLWEMLTGRELSLGSAIARGQRPRPSVAKLNLSLPKGSAPIPALLAETVHSALELAASNRIGTRRELRKALTSELEIASYAQVIDFTDALLHRESTLFRLTLDTGPKLSDEKRVDRTKPRNLEGVMELAKQAQAKEPTQPSMVSRAPSKPQQPKPTPVGGVTVAIQPSPMGGPTTATQPSPIGGTTIAIPPSPVGTTAAQPSPVGGPTAAIQPSPIGGTTVAVQPSPIGGATIAIPARVKQPSRPEQSRPEQPKPELKSNDPTPAGAADTRGTLGANLSVHPALPFKPDKGLKRTLIGVSPDPSSAPTELSPTTASPDNPDAARFQAPKADRAWAKRTLVGIQPDKEPSQPTTQPVQVEVSAREGTARISSQKSPTDFGRTVRIQPDQASPNLGQTVRVPFDKGPSGPNEHAGVDVGAHPEELERIRDGKPGVAGSNAMSLLNAELGQAATNGSAAATQASTELPGAKALVELLPPPAEDSVKPEAPRKRSIQLSLTTIIIGLVSAVALAVGVTVLILTSSKPSPSSSVAPAPLSPASVAPVANPTAPATPVEPPPPPETAPAAQPAATESATTAAPPAIAESATPTASDAPRAPTSQTQSPPSSGQVPLSNPKPAQKPTSVAPKGKKPKQYVPRGL